MKALLTAIYTLLSSFNPTLVSLATITVSLVSLFNWLNSQWTLMLAKIDILAGSSFSGSISVSPAGLLNTFIPLTEALSFFSLFLTILVAAAVVRIVKSFIPTIAT